MSSQKVVIIGGGYSGVAAAKDLDKTFDVTLVAGGEMFRHVVGGIRAIVLPETIAKIHIPYDNLLKRGTVKACAATKIDAAECKVTIATGETLSYDFLILATGGLHARTVGMGGGYTTAAGQSIVFKKGNEELKAATNILIVGAGPIGIEMAGEIMEEMPGKSVTIVTSKEIMPVADGPDFPQKFRPRLLEKLQKIGVTVHTDAGRVNCSLNEVNEGGFIVGKKTYTWNGGEMEADLCIVATGMRQIPPLYADSGLESWLDDKGLVSVDSTYEVTGAGGGGKVFAIGDCTNLPIPKVVYLALLAGQAMVKQVAASAAGNPLKELAPKNPVAFSFVPVGKSGGVSALPVMGVVVGDFMTRNIKSKDMFCAKYWAELNAGKPPVVL